MADFGELIFLLEGAVNVLLKLAEGGLEWRSATYLFHVFGNTVINSSTQMMATSHPPMAAVTHDRIQLLEISVVQEPSKIRADRANVNLAIELYRLLGLGHACRFHLLAVHSRKICFIGQQPDPRTNHPLTYNVQDLQALWMDNFDGRAYSRTAGRLSFLRASRK